MNMNNNNKIINQAIIIFICCICIIGLLLIYSYNNKFNNNIIENFVNVIENYTNIIENFNSSNNVIIDNEDIEKINEIKEKLQILQNYHNTNFNIYDIQTIDKYNPILKLSPEIFKFDNIKYSNNFYQNIQNTEIKDLEKNYNILKNELISLNLNKNDNKVNRIKHIPSGSVFLIHGYNNNILNSNFNIILNSEKSICLEFKSINPNYIYSSPINNTINNIDNIPCDFGDKESLNISSTLKNIIQKQKFIPVKINNNDDYNNNLHSSFNVYKIPIDTNLDNNTIDFTYSLNNYPYYIIKPLLDNNNMCLTISNNMLSIEPCNGNENQKFELLYM